MQHQISNATNYNRYPKIFKECVKYFKDITPTILSFGCSDGREVLSLHNLYFKNSNIDGVDISKDMILKCKESYVNEKLNFYTSDEFLPKKYDLIFCMSVLCRWSQTKNVEDCGDIYPFDQFESQLVMLNELLNVGGLIVIYNSNFLFTDTKLSLNYTPLETEVDESGFVKKFDKNNKHIDINYPHTIFIKNK
jgi:hypothetical protein